MSTVALWDSVNPPSRQVHLLLALEYSGALIIEYTMLLHNDFLMERKTSRFHLKILEIWESIFSLFLSIAA